MTPSSQLARHRPVVFLYGVLLVIVIGCGKAPEQLVPVSGRVLFDGKPVPAGKVVFCPDPDKGNGSQREPRGTIDAQGVYRLTTDDREGAPLGWYKVAIFAMETHGDSASPVIHWYAPQRYSDVRSSGLTVQIVENSAAWAYDFNLRR